MSIRTICLVGLLCAVGCESNARGSRMAAVDGGGGPADSGEVADPRCSATAFTGMACTVEQIGVSCPGSSMCACAGGDFRTVMTSCTCNETGALGRIFECADACATACASDAGAPDAGPPPVVVSCAEYCAHLNTVRCERDFSACEGACESLREMGCADEMNAVLACAIDAPVVCSPDGQLPMVTGCEAEDSAWSDCFSP